jgi:hypothetical protein
VGKAPPHEKMLKMKIDPDKLLKTKGEKITTSDDPNNSMKTNVLS